MLLGRPWRDHASVTFLTCELPAVITPAGWHNWDQPAREKTARFAEFGNSPGANLNARVPWARQLGEDEARAITVRSVLNGEDGWTPDVAPAK
jgi:pectinesterase